MVPDLYPTYSLPLLSEYVFCTSKLHFLYRQFTPLALLQKSRQKHGSYVWTKAPSGMVSVSA